MIARPSHRACVQSQRTCVENGRRVRADLASLRVATVNGQVARVAREYGAPVDVILEKFGFNRMTRAALSAARREPRSNRF